jgi:hypothetical protein
MAYIDYWVDNKLVGIVQRIGQQSNSSHFYNYHKIIEMHMTYNCYYNFNIYQYMYLYK